MTGKNGAIIRDTPDEALLATIDLSGLVYSLDDDAMIMLTNGGIVSETHLDEMNAERIAKKLPALSGKAFTIARACIEGLGSIFEGETVSNDEKLDRHLLALEIKRNPRTPLSPEQIALIKERVGKAYPPHVMGQVFLALDPGVKARKQKVD